MRTAVVTDSSACLPARAAELGVVVVPIPILLPTLEARDGEIDEALVHEALAGDEAVKTLAPSALDYVSTVEAVDADAAVILTPAAEFTAMWRNACLAAYLLDCPVTVVDTRTAAAAQGLVVVAAAKLATAGAASGEVVRAAEDAARRADLVASLDTIALIERGGRVPSAGLEQVRRRRTRLLFRFREGDVRPVSAATPATRPIEALAGEWRRSGAPADRTVVFHAGAPGQAADLLDAIGGGEQPVPCSPAMTVHTGLGTVGVAWLAPPAPPPRR